ncbi:hypothetical protein ACLOJK_041675 [Asimina triloba]
MSAIQPNVIRWRDDSLIEVNSSLQSINHIPRKMDGLDEDYIMYPNLVSFERDLKLLQSQIPSYSVSIHTLQLQRHIMIPTPAKPTNIPTLEADHEDSHKKKSKRKRSIHDQGLAEEKATGQDQSHAGNGNDIETLRNGSFGSGGLGIGFLSQYPLQMMDGFSVDVSNGEEYQRKGNDNAIDVVSAAERKHKRMIKNRESAARSRARKQTADLVDSDVSRNGAKALVKYRIFSLPLVDCDHCSRFPSTAYTSQLEIEVAELKEENACLKKRRKVLEGISDAEPALPEEVPQKAHSAAF